MRREKQKGGIEEGKRRELRGIEGGQGGGKRREEKKMKE